MRRHVRVLVAAGTLGASLLLAGCEQPVPKVTVQTGSFSTTITPSTYCFDAAHCRVHTGLVDLPVITTHENGSVLIDVPRTLVGQGWAVQAFSLSPTRKLIGGSGTIRNSHSYRLVSNANNDAPFLVEIDQIRHGKADQSRWTFLVQVATTTT